MAEGFIAQNPDLMIADFEVPYDATGSCIAVKKGNTELKETIQAGFDQLIENGKAAEISEKWFGKDIVLKP